MSFKKKLKKFRRDPKKFFEDSKLFNKFNLFKNDKLLEKGNDESEHSIKKSEPLIFGKFKFSKNILELTVHNKNVINTNLGFSTLFIINSSNKYLIHQNLIRSILKDKEFIAFKDKSLYFLTSENTDIVDIDERKNYEIFLRNKELRSNNFSSFRNLICKNPTNPMFLFIRQSNPFIKNIIIIDNLKNLNYIKQYSNYIDILIVKDSLNIEELGNIPRIIKYNSIFDSLKFNIKHEINSLMCYNNSFDSLVIEEESTILDAIKTAIIDSSYKKDCNLLLPILSNSPNLDKIDYYNDNYTIHGLIKFKINSKISFNTFEELIENIEIEELYLRDNLYSIYKDMILKASNESDYKQLLRRTLNDGVYYEKI